MKRFISFLLAEPIAVLLFSLYAAIPARAQDKFVEVRDIPDGMALVYLYKPGQVKDGKPSYLSKAGQAKDGTAIAAYVESYMVYANEKPVAAVSENGYYPYICEPGKIIFWTQIEIVQPYIEVEVEEGHVYFLKTDLVRWAKEYTYLAEIKLMPHEIGKNEIQDCSFTEGLILDR